VDIVWVTCKNKVNRFAIICVTWTRRLIGSTQKTNSVFPVPAHTVLYETRPVKNLINVLMARSWTDKRKRNIKKWHEHIKSELQCQWNVCLRRLDTGRTAVSRWVSFCGKCISLRYDAELLPDLESLFINSHSHDEYLWQVSLKSVH